VAKLRQFPNLSTLFDHPPRVLVSHGQVLTSELRRAGLTIDDLYGLLRQHGVLDVKDAYLVIFEQRGRLSVIKQADLRESEPQLLRDIE
jgi:uncharacterized membrane protein YcaP (DUF421 family)